MPKTQTKFRIREATESDLPALVRIYNWAVENTVATFDLEPLTIEQRRGWFAQFGAEYPLLVCEDAGRAVGYAYYLPYRHKPAYNATKETTIYIDPEYHKRGVGGLLYEELIERARKAKVHVLIAVLGGENPGSEALHKKFGFELVGHEREVGFKFGRWVDSYTFEKIL
jgi:L-amino acid N-acyltransferase YncA